MPGKLKAISKVFDGKQSKNAVASTSCDLTGKLPYRQKRRFWLQVLTICVAVACLGNKSWGQERIPGQEFQGQTNLKPGTFGITGRFHSDQAKERQQQIDRLNKLYLGQASIAQQADKRRTGRLQESRTAEQRLEKMRQIANEDEQVLKSAKQQLREIENRILSEEGTAYSHSERLVREWKSAQQTRLMQLLPTARIGASEGASSLAPLTAKQKTCLSQDMEYQRLSAQLDEAKVQQKKLRSDLLTGNANWLTADSAVTSAESKLNLSEKNVKVAILAKKTAETAVANENRIITSSNLQAGQIATELAALNARPPAVPARQQ